MTTKFYAQISVQFVNGGFSEIKAKFNKIVPKCSFSTSFGGFCTINNNFCVLNLYLISLVVFSVAVGSI